MNCTVLLVFLNWITAGTSEYIVCITRVVLQDGDKRKMKLARSKLSTRINNDLGSESELTLFVYNSQIVFDESKGLRDVLNNV